jgi:hypothetical protein
MSGKRLLLLLAVLAAAAADLLFYDGSARVSAAARRPDPAARMEILSGGQDLAALNDLQYRDLGRAAFEAAVVDLTAAESRDRNLRSAYQAQMRSLAVNPLSAATHFDLAQTLDYMTLFDLPAAGRPMDESIKTVRLAGQDAEILAATGRVLLSSWPRLTVEERALARDVTRSALAVRPGERLEGILDLWALRVQDPAFMRAVLPPDAEAYRTYARFLAERGLDRGERIHFLAEAEAIDLQKAAAAAAAGRSEFLAARMKPAEAHFREGLRLLDGLRSYRDLDPASGKVSAASIRDLRKSLRLGLARCRLETARSLDGILDDLQAYLEVEDSAAAVAELEKSLRSRRLIEAKPDASGKDLARLAFELDLLLRQNRYREVVSNGQSLEAGLVMVTEAVRPDYAAILERIGDAYRKLDFLYESNRFYQKARESRPSASPELLGKMVRNYERLNDTAALAGLRREAAGLFSPRRVDWSGILLPKGTPFKTTLVLEAKESRLSLEILPRGPFPVYVTVVLKGRIVWEDFASGAPVTVSLTPETGAQELEILPWNGPLALTGLELAVEEGEKAGGGPPPATSGRRE